MSTQKNSEFIRKLVLAGILTALVIILQLLGSFIRFGPFSITLVLLPIIIGAATCGPIVSTWLGFVFGLVVLLSGDATLFMTFDPFGTIVTVLAKGTLCGLGAGLVYKLILFLLNKYSTEQAKVMQSKYGVPGEYENNIYRYLSRNNTYVAVLVAALVCPLINTGIFVLGCRIFFMDLLSEWSQGAGYGRILYYVLFAMIGGNFLFEIASNIILSPIAVRLINIRNKMVK